uniref:Somatostatin-b n=1 Tax=Lethenteron camtschaticum TaxID=980415 RepID=A0A1B3IK53_LETCA|nr:somatostatin-b [Lethenteron camtschaticum]
MPAMPTTCVLLLFSLGVTALLPRPLGASPFRRPAEGSSLAGLGAWALGPGAGPGGAGLIDDRLQQRVEAVLTQELSREERALVGRLLAELAAGGAGLGGALPPLGWGPGSSSDEEGGEEGEGAGGDGGRGERALSARVRKAGCKNFFWKTFTSC